MFNETLPESWTHYFHFPKGKTKEYSELRNYTTYKYGIITTVLLCFIILFIPIYHYIILHNYRLKFHFLKRFYTRLNHYIKHDHKPNCAQATFRDRFNSRAAQAVKSFAFYILLHLSTITQLIFWTAFLSTMSLIDIYHGDLIFLAKRLGRVAANCMPTVLFLTLRPSPLPNILYLTLIPIHKWLSRLIVLQSVLHTLIYLAYFDFSHTWQKTWKRENIYGWVALLGFLVIVVTSLSSFRRRWYKIFYIMHYSWTWIIVACLQIHVRPQPFTFYTLANIAILVGQIAYRWHLTRVSVRGEVKVIDVSPNLSLVEFPNSLISKQATAPGAHIRLTNYSSSWIVRVFKQIIPNYHPYTLVSLPQDRYQRLIIRKSNFQLFDGHKYLITGSYDPHLLFINYKLSNSIASVATSNNYTNNHNNKNPSKNNKWMLSKLHVDAKRILIVVGGSAISFALPILRAMNYHGVPTKVVWVIKDFRDILVLNYFDGFIHGEDFEIFVTGSNTLDEKSITLKNCKSNLSKRSIGALSAHYDLENERIPLLGSNEQITSLNQENQVEDVDVGINSDEEADAIDDGDSVAFTDADCTHHTTHMGIQTSTPRNRCPDNSAVLFDDIDDVLENDVSQLLDNRSYNIGYGSSGSIGSGSNNNNNVNDNHNYAYYDEFEVTNDTINQLPSAPQSPQQDSHLHLHTRASSPLQASSPAVSSAHVSRRPSMNEPFIPIYSRSSPAQSISWISQFTSLTRKLNIQHKIYKGRPKLNYRYYNWCINEGFTQCSGPTLDEHNNLVCCQDLPRNKVVEEDLNAEKIWVIGAGPKQLVENVKLWSSENGLKFHEEAFYS